MKLLADQINEFNPELVVTADENDGRLLQKKYPHIEVMCGRHGLIEAAKIGCDMVVNGLMGMRGLEPTYHAVMAGRDIALANKETLVSGGEAMKEER